VGGRELRGQRSGDSERDGIDVTTAYNNLSYVGERTRKEEIVRPDTKISV
jgi:hypothetical protein